MECICSSTMHYVKGLKGLCFNIRIHVHVVALAAILRKEVVFSVVQETHKCNVISKVILVTICHTDSGMLRMQRHTIVICDLFHVFTQSLLLQCTPHVLCMCM